MAKRRDGGVKSKSSCLPGRRWNNRCAFSGIEDYDGVIALWRRTEAWGLNESDTRRAIAA